MTPVKRKILVVDDNYEFAKTIARNLEKEGFQISLASDGNAAILAASNESPDLVLLDLKLPDIPGVELLRIMKSINENVAVIIITAYGGERVAIDLMKAGAIDFLSKPFNFEDLLNSINNAFKISDAQKEVQHLNEFVQEFLDFVRPPSESRFVQIDINEVISFIVNTIPHRFEELSQKIRVTTDLASQVPKFFGNYEEIRQALLNIVRNGLEAMDEGQCQKTPWQDPNRESGRKRDDGCRGIAY